MVTVATAATGQADYHSADSGNSDVSTYGQTSDSKHTFKIPVTIEKTKEGWTLKLHLSQGLIDLISDSDSDKKEKDKQKGDDEQQDGENDEDKDNGEKDSGKDKGDEEKNKDSDKDDKNEKDEDKPDDKETVDDKDEQEDEDKSDEKDKDSDKDNKNKDYKEDGADNGEDEQQDDEKDKDSDKDKDKDGSKDDEKQDEEKEDSEEKKENDKNKDDGEKEHDDEGDSNKDRTGSGYKGKNRGCYDYKGDSSDMYEHWKNGKLQTAEFRFLTPPGQGTEALEYDSSCGERDDDSSEDKDSDQGDEDQDNTDDPKDGEDSSENDSEGDLGVCVIGVDSPCNSEEYDGDNETGDNNTDGDSGVTEEAAQIEAPEEGDYWFEAEGDGWISYLNPRDEYRSDYVSGADGPGSGKVCTVLLNEAGEPITGETVPNTEVRFPMGEFADWHPHANPITAEYPLTENYERPLDSDQFGTHPDLPQGDGYMDSHCIELHQMDEDTTMTYGEAEVVGEHAEDIEILGYYDKINTWNSDVDPVEIADPYGATSSSDGEIQFSPGNTHGEAYVILQLDR